MSKKPAKRQKARSNVRRIAPVDVSKLPLETAFVERLLLEMTEISGVQHIAPKLPTLGKPYQIGWLLNLLKPGMIEAHEVGFVMKQAVELWPLPYYRVASRVLAALVTDTDTRLELIKAAMDRGDYSLYVAVRADFAPKPYYSAAMATHAARHGTVPIYRDARKHFCDQDPDGENDGLDPDALLVAAVQSLRIGMFRQVLKDYGSRLSPSGPGRAMNTALAQCDHQSGNLRERRMRDAVRVWKQKRDAQPKAA